MFAWFAFFKRNLREKLRVTSAKFFLDKKYHINSVKFDNQRKTMNFEIFYIDTLLKIYMNMMMDIFFNNPC